LGSNIDYLNAPDATRSRQTCLPLTPSNKSGRLSGELGRSTVTHEISEGKSISKSAEEGGRVASVGVRNPSLSRTGVALHRIDFVSSQRWLLHLRETGAVAGRRGMLSDLRRHRNLSGRLSWRPHFLGYCSTELARYPRAGANRGSGSTCVSGRAGVFQKKKRARRQRLSVRFGAMVAELSF
jgi:hypothetical protein